MPLLAFQPSPWRRRIPVRIAVRATPRGSVCCSLFGDDAGPPKAAFTIPADAAEWAVEIRVAS